jgi:hypothetical protein
MYEATNLPCRATSRQIRSNPINIINIFCHKIKILPSIKVQSRRFKNRFVFAEQSSTIECTCPPPPKKKVKIIYSMSLTQKDISNVLNTT